MCNPKTTTEAWGRCYHNYKVVITVCQGIRGQNFKTHLYMLSQMCQFSKKKLLYTVGSEQCWPYRNNTTLINGIIHPEGDSMHQFLLRISILQPTLLSATKAGYGCCIADLCKIVFTSCTFATHLKRYKKLYQKHGILRVKRQIGSVNDTKYSELMQCISRCCNVLTVKLYQLIVGSTTGRTWT